MGLLKIYGPFSEVYSLFAIYSHEFIHVETPQVKHKVYMYCQLIVRKKLIGLNSLAKMGYNKANIAGCPSGLWECSPARTLGFGIHIPLPLLFLFSSGSFTEELSEFK